MTCQILRYKPKKKTEAINACSVGAARQDHQARVENSFIKARDSGTLRDTELRFSNMISYSDTCWIWNGCKSHEGYGKLTRRINGRLVSYLAHRFLFRHLNLCDLFCCHRCDNPSCVRPTHIFFGTPLDNARDCISKGRFNFEDASRAIIRYSTGRNRSGMNCGQSKLTDEQVKEIRSTKRTRRSCYELAAKFGVSHITIRKISNGIGWKHI